MREGKWPQAADGLFISVRALAQAAEWYAANAILKSLILLVVVDRNLRTMEFLTLRFVRNFMSIPQGTKYYTPLKR